MVEYIPWFIVIEKLLECECPLHWATYIFLMLSMSVSWMLVFADGRH